MGERIGRKTKVKACEPGTLYLLFSMMTHSMKYPFGHFGSAVLSLYFPSFLCASSLLSCQGSVSSAQQQLKHQCDINITDIVNPKHSTIPTTRKNINSIPDEARTPLNIPTVRNPLGGEASGWLLENYYKQMTLKQ